MTDSLDRLLIAPLLGVACYLMHFALYFVLFIWIAPMLRGGTYWLAVTSLQLLVALLVAVVVALPLAYVYRNKTIYGGVVTGAVASGVYVFHIFNGPTGSTLSISFSVLKVSFLMFSVPFVSWYAAQGLLPRFELSQKGRGVDG